MSYTFLSPRAHNTLFHMSKVILNWDIFIGHRALTQEIKFKNPTFWHFLIHILDPPDTNTRITHYQHLHIRRWTLNKATNAQPSSEEKPVYQIWREKLDHSDI